MPKRKGLGMHSFPRPPKKNTRERTAELAARLASGDKSARDELISANAGLALVLVDKHIRRMPSKSYLRDDLVSVAMLALVAAVDRIAAKAGKHDGPDNATGYLACVIDSAIRQHHDDGVGGLHSATRWREWRRVKDREPRRVPQPVDIEEFVPQYIDIPDEATQGAAFDNFTDEDFRSSELTDTWDAVHAACKTDNERAAVRLTSEGKSRKEIAAELGFSKQHGHHTVSKLLRIVHKRLKDADV